MTFLSDKQSKINDLLKNMKEIVDLENKISNRPCRVDIDIWKNEEENSFYTKTMTFSNLKDATRIYNEMIELPIRQRKGIYLLVKEEGLEPL